MQLQHDDPLAQEIMRAIHNGDVDPLRGLLIASGGLAQACIVDAKGSKRTLLLIATDWPGHFPNVAATIAALLEAGADVNARTGGRINETPLHWAASSNDVAALGRMDLMDALAANADSQQLTGSLWSACWGGQRETAAFLMDRGADINWIGWDRKTPLDAAATGAGPHLVEWLRQCGAKSARELHP